MKLKQIPEPSSKLLFFPQHDDEYKHFEDAEKHRFDPSEKGFSRVNAWWLADAALLAYWDEAPARDIWSRAGLQFHFLDNEGVQCHIGSTDAFVIVAFRGTQPDDWHDLLDITRSHLVNWEFGGKVHEGFCKAHGRIWRRVANALNDLNVAHRPVWFTGHSLGAALATLSMDRFAAERDRFGAEKVAARLYTIGSPPVGNRRFATLFDQKHAGLCFRYVNHRDLVVYLPRLLHVLLGNYTHVRERRYINARGTISTGSLSVAHWLSLLLRPQIPPLVLDPFAMTPLPEVLVDHTPRRYAVYIWNDYQKHPSPGATTPASG